MKSGSIRYKKQALLFQKEGKDWQFLNEDDALKDACTMLLPNSVQIPEIDFTLFFFNKHERL